MSKAYRVSKRTVMFDKKNPKTVYSVSPVNYGTLSTDDVAGERVLATKLEAGGG